MLPKNDHRPFQRCTKTVMDTSDPNITFDDKGICHYWHQYQEYDASLGPMEERKKRFEKTVEEVKEAGKGKPYDCLIGVSGGIDSTYVALIVKEYGLRPLAVHFDGGWDNDYGRHNMKILEDNLGLEIHTLKVAFEEIRDLLLAYLRASVVDIGVYADHAITATMYNLAAKNKVEYVFHGNNYRTEFIAPKAWIYNKSDLINLRDIHSKFGRLKSLPTYPTYGFFDQIRFQTFHRLKTVEVLDHFEFETKKIEQLLSEKLDWRPYPRKHGESLFTTFMQNYIYPEKFGVDKRIIHLSSLICSGQMTREKALKILEQPLYDKKEFEQDLEIVLQRLQLSRGEFEEIMNAPIKSHFDYKTDKVYRDNYMKFMRSTYGFRKSIKRAIGVGK
jgi:N-acetyl sugar amidotransferase